MSLFRIFDFSDEKALAEVLVLHLTKNLPPKLLNERRQVLSAKKVSRLLEQAFETARDQQAKSGTNFVKRAVLANNFKWALREKGYPQDFIDVATEGLLVELGRNRGAPQVK